VPISRVLRAQYRHRKSLQSAGDAVAYTGNEQPCVARIDVGPRRFCDRRIDREIAHARSLQTSDPGTASRLWTTIDRDLTDRAPWVAFANGVVLEVKSTRVGNYQNNPQWGTLLDQLWVR
jgi:hypothetical protein